MFKLMRIRHLLFCYYATFQTAAQCRLYLFRVELSISLKGEVCNMEKKDHYRLYKSGKRWLAALVVTVAGGAVLTTAGPTVQAAGTDDAAKVTAAEPASWETQLAALKSAVAAGNWGNLTVNNQTVSAVLAGVTDEASFTVPGAKSPRRSSAIPWLASLPSLPTKQHSFKPNLPMRNMQARQTLKC